MMPLLPGLRRSTFACLTLVALACGGGGDGGGVVTPPPAPNRRATSVSVHAGDGQVASASTALPIAPAVIVRDEASLPMAGVAVAFAVDSGGGQLANASATTDANGVASTGWTLGAVDGANVLVATVAGLTPARIRATARTDSIVLVDQLVPREGGLLTFTRPGSDLHGVQVDIPRGTYTTEQRWRVVARPKYLVPLPAGVSRFGPAIEIGNDQLYADSTIGITVPMRVGLDTALAAFAHDPATGRLELLPVVARDSASITIATPHVRNEFLWTPRAPGAAVPRLSSGRATFGSLTIIFAGIPPAMLNGSIATNFAPGVDDWEFDNFGSVTGPGGICLGMSITSLYYFSRIKGQTGKGLFGRYDRIPRYPWDNPQGIRFASVIQEASVLYASYIAGIRARAQASKLSPDVVFYHSLLTAFATTGEPQVFVLTKAAGAGHAVIAYAANAGKISLADPNQPGVQGVTATFSGNRFQPVSFRSIATGPADSYTTMLVPGTSSFIATTTLDAEWQNFQAGKAGDKEFPVVRWAWRGDASSPLQLLADSATGWGYLQMGFKCPTCTSIDASGPEVITTTGQRMNNPVLLSAAFRDSIGYPAMINDRFTNFTWTLARVRPFAIEGPVIMFTGESVDFVARPNGSVPAGARFVWDFGDGTAPVTVAGDSTVSYTYRTPDDQYDVTVELRDAAGKVLALAGKAVVVTRPTWNITSFVQTGLTYAPDQTILQAEMGLSNKGLRDALTTDLTLAKILVVDEPEEIDADSYDGSPPFLRGIPAKSQAVVLMHLGEKGYYVEFLTGGGSPTVTTMPPGIHPLGAFSNAHQLTSTKNGTMRGRAANWIRPVPLSPLPCPSSGPNPQSPVYSHLEVDATVTPTGLQGDITFVTTVSVTIRDDNSFCLVTNFGEVRRTYRFTARRLPAGPSPANPVSRSFSTEDRRAGEDLRRRVLLRSSRASVLNVLNSAH